MLFKNDIQFVFIIQVMSYNTVLKKVIKKKLGLCLPIVCIFVDSLLLIIQMIAGI